MESRRSPLELASFYKPEESQSGVAFGEDISISSPPNRSQRGGKPGTTAAEKSLHQSGFGGWVDEKMEVPREAGPLLLAQQGQRIRQQEISSTTFDNTSRFATKGKVKLRIVLVFTIVLMPSLQIETKAFFHLVKTSLDK
jgi:hypothetical protein